MTNPDIINLGPAVEELKQRFTEHLLLRDFPPEIIDRLFKLLLPEVTQETSAIDGVWVFKITNSEIVSLIACVIACDSSHQLHQGEAGIAHTLVIMAMCSAVASAVRPNFVLAKISPDISFNSPVPLGATVILTVKLLRANRVKTTLELTACLERCETIIFTERVISMVDPEALKKLKEARTK